MVAHIATYRIVQLTCFPLVIVKISVRISFYRKVCGTSVVNAEGVDMRLSQTRTAIKLFEQPVQKRQAHHGTLFWKPQIQPASAAYHRMKKSTKTLTNRYHGVCIISDLNKIHIQWLWLFPTNNGVLCPISVSQEDKSISKER